MKSKILFLVIASATVAVCSLSVKGADLHATRTLKQNHCYSQDGGWTGICTADCDAGMVVVSGGCIVSPQTIGLSMNYPSSAVSPPGQWACQPTAAADYVEAYVICE
jgi:hypothetical protein